MYGDQLSDTLALDAATESIYLAMLANPGWGVTELAEKLAVGERQVRAALDQLFHLSLLRESFGAPEVLRVVNPQVAIQSVLARQQAELARHQEEIARGQAALAAIVAGYTDWSPGSPPVQAETLVGMDAVHDRLEQLTRFARTEVLSLMPGGGQSPPALEAGRRNNTILLARGVQIHSVLQDSARNDPATVAYAEWLTGNGGAVRTAAVLPPRLLVVDRNAALVPTDPDDSRAGAVLLTGSGVIAAMVALFESVWAMAAPLGTDRARDDDGLTGQERELLRLLAKGLTDEAAAKRLGVSGRTARRTVAALMERLCARSRFEAGLRAAQRGWI